METIKERARELYREDIGVWTRAGAEYLQKTYIRGAADQHRIDIEKACEWLKSHTNDKWVYDGK